MKEKTDKDDTNKFIYIKKHKKNNNKEKTVLEKTEPES